MKLLLSLFAAAVFTLPSYAEVDPPVAWSNEKVTLRAFTEWYSSCPPQSETTVVTGQTILITIVQSTLPQCFPTVPVVSGVTVTPTVGPLAPGVYDVRLRSVFGATPVERSVRTLIVRDADAAFTVEPQVFFHTMNEVEIRWKTPHDLCGDVLPCQPVVTIGGQPAPVVRTLPSGLVVRRPAMASGTYDVVVKEGDVTSVARAAVTVADLGSIPPQLVERLLIPVLWGGPGALGSRWMTDVWLRNENAYRINTTDLTLGGCPVLISPCPVFPLESGEVYHLTGEENSPYATGRQFFVSRGAADGLRTTALVRDLSRQNEALGAELPIVRERDFHDEPFSLVHVPVGGNFRTALRVYGTRGGTIRLRIIAVSDTEGERVLVDQERNLAGSNDSSIPPTAIYTDLAAQFPALQGVEAVRIEIRGNDSLWAFASVTNNVTQHVTNIRPQ